MSTAPSSTSATTSRIDALFVNVTPKGRTERLYYGTRQSSFESDVYIIEVDRRILTQQRVRLADFHNNNELANLYPDCKQHPSAVVSLVYAMQKCVYDCDVISREILVADEVGEIVGPDGKKKKFKAERPKKKHTFIDGGGRAANRVEEYVEHVKDESDAVIGFRFWYFVKDSTLSLDVGLLSQFNWQRKDAMSLREKESPSNTTKMLEVYSQDQWINSVVGFYQKPPALAQKFTEGRLLEELHYPLYETDKNLVACENLLGGRTVFQHSIFAGRCKEGYLNLARYDTPPGVRFPFGAIYVEHEDRQPDFFHQVILVEHILTRRFIAHYSEQLKKIEIMRKHDEVVKARALRTSDTNTMEQVVLANKSDLEKIYAPVDKLQNQLDDALQNEAPAEEIANLEAELRIAKDIAASKRNDWETGSDVKERMNILFTAPAGLSPGHAACVNWFLEQQMEALKNNKRWSAMSVTKGVLDPSLSVFGHFITREMFIYENVFGIATLHKELLMFMLHRLGSTDTRRSRLKNHLILLGPHSAGKSVILDFTDQCSVAGSAQNITHETDKAYATNTNHDYTMKFHDELAKEKWFAKGDANEGDSMLKTMLTKKQLTGNYCDPETRQTQTYIAYMDIVMFALSNANKSDIPPALASRVLLPVISRWIRPKFDMTLKMTEMSNDARDVNIMDKITDELQRLQCLSGFVDMLIHAKILRQIDTRASDIHISTVIGELQENGVLIEPRLRTQIENLVRILTLYHAVRRVFFTTAVFTDKNKEFEPVDLLAVKPYLFSTLEHVVFAFTMLKDILVDSAQEKVNTTLHRMCTQVDNPSYLKVRKTTAAPTAPTVGGAPAPTAPPVSVMENDYNYYNIKLSQNVTQEKVWEELAGKIRHDIQLKDKEVVHLSLITNVLKQVEADMKTCTYRYDENNQKIMGDPTNMPILKIDPQNNKLSVSILRQHLEGFASASGVVAEDTLTKALNKLQTEHTAKSRLVTGISYRKVESMYPFLLQVMEFGPKKGVPTIIANLQFRTPGFGEMVHGVPRVNQYPTRQLELNLSVDEYYYNKFADELQLVERPSAFPTDVGTGETVTRPYPSFYISQHKREVNMVGSTKVYDDGALPPQQQPAPPTSDEERTRARFANVSISGGASSTRMEVEEEEMR